MLLPPSSPVIPEYICINQLSDHPPCHTILYVAMSPPDQVCDVIILVAASLGWDRFSCIVQSWGLPEVGMWW